MEECKNWIIVKNGKIAGAYSSITQPENAVEVDIQAMCQAVIGESVDWYDDNFHRIPDAELIKQGKKEMPEGSTIENGVVREKTLQEKYRDGDVSVPAGFVYDKKLCDIREKTLKEMYETGEWTIEELSAKISELILKNLQNTENLLNLVQIREDEEKYPHEKTRKEGERDYIFQYRAYLFDLMYDNPLTEDHLFFEVWDYKMWFQKTCCEEPKTEEEKRLEEIDADGDGKCDLCHRDLD